MRLRTALLTTCLSLSFAPGLAWAQEGASDASTGGGEIVVTARRREEALQDVPIAVSALSGDQLQKTGVSDIQGLQYRTPSLSITSGQSQRNTVSFSLRGQRAQETQLFTDPPVGTYFAEVVQPRPYGFGNALYDLQSVQVLKGVQGTLFGRNMTGGAVLVEPAHPKLGEFSGEVRGQYGNYDMHDIYGMVNIPVGDAVAFRIAGKTHERDGWSHDIGSGLDLDNQNYDTFRVSALVSPGNGIESLTVFDWYKSNENGTASFLTSIDPNSPVIQGYQQLGVNIPQQFADAQALFRSRRFTQNAGAGNGSNLDVFGLPFERIKNWGITNKTTWELTDTLTLKNIFGYRKQRREIVQDYDGIQAFLITPYQFAHSRNISEELQLQAKAFENRLDLILGGYYFEEKGLDGSLANTLPQLNMARAGFNPSTTDATLFINSNPGRGYSRTAAAFAAGTFKVTDKLSLSGGLRYNYDKRKITVSPTQPNFPNADGTTGRCIFDTMPDNPTVPESIGTQTVPLSQCAFTNSKSFKEWTYDATVQYEPSPEVTAYASYRHGFRAGGFSTRATNAITLRPFLPEFVDEYEIGLKTNTRLGAGRLTTSTALFRQDGSDVQKQRASFIDGNVYTIVDNTAKQRNMGGEFEATFSTDTFSLTGFYSYTNVDIRSGRVVLNGLPEFEQRGVPKHQVGATATISPPVSEKLGELNFVLNYTWRSKIYLDDFEIQGLQPSYSLINLRAELLNVGGSRASVAAFVNNATNETYRIGVLGLIAEGLGFQNSVYGEPRTYGLELGYKF